MYWSYHSGLLHKVFGYYICFIFFLVEHKLLISFPLISVSLGTSRMPRLQASSVVNLSTGVIPAKKHHFLAMPVPAAWFFGVQLPGLALVPVRFRSLVMVCNGQQSNDGVRAVGLEPSLDTGQLYQSLIIRKTCLHGVTTDIIITMSVLLFPRLLRQSISNYMWVDTENNVTRVQVYKPSYRKPSHGANSESSS